MPDGGDTYQEAEDAAMTAAEEAMSL